jgi:carboxyl-terminal processing protease
MKTVKDKMLKNKIGYIRISSFDTSTYEEFIKSFNKLKSQKMQALVIDVRDDPGGVLDSVVKVADRLMPKGIIVYTLDKSKKRNDWYSDATEAKLPMAILVNGNSASASEILAGALKDSKKATLIGTKTFGKGVVQEVIDLSDGTALKVTVSEYFTPNGINIQGKGIKPDIEVKLPEKYKTSMQIKDGEDTQLNKAIDFLGKKLKK